MRRRGLGGLGWPALALAALACAARPAAASPGGEDGGSISGADGEEPGAAAGAAAGGTGPGDETGPGGAESRGPGGASGSGEVQLDFTDADLPAVIDTIARLTGKNFVYDDRVRGKVTVVSPAPVDVEQALAIFESVLQLKGFATVRGPGGAIKVVPSASAHAAGAPTLGPGTPVPASDRVFTRLFTLRHADAVGAANALRPLLSKDAVVVPFAATSTLIVTDAGTNLRKAEELLLAIDRESLREEVEVLPLAHADAATLARQLDQVYGSGARSGGPPGAAPDGGPGGARGDAGRLRVLADARTNALVLAGSAGRLAEARALAASLDVAVVGGGSIRVHRLRHADARDVADTLHALLSGQSRPRAGAQGAGAEAPAADAMRAAVTALQGGVQVTPDPATNALVVQASPEAYQALAEVIEALDVRRAQVLVEALILEVVVADSRDLGFNGFARLVRDDWDVSAASVHDPATSSLLGLPGIAGLPGFIGNALRRTFARDADGHPTGEGSLIQGILRAAATASGTNVLSAPHVLTSDNEEAEIKIGDNIPIITSRLQSAQGGDNLATSVNVQRLDIGVTLRVTPHVHEGSTLRLELFQDVTDVNPALSALTGSPEDVGVATTKRTIHNTVVVADGETVVIGGLLSDSTDRTERKVPGLGDVPLLGHLFKSTHKGLGKKNLLVFLTPHIVRQEADLARQTARKREEFRQRSGQDLRGPAADALRRTGAERGPEEEDGGAR